MSHCLLRRVRGELEDPFGSPPSAVSTKMLFLCVVLPILRVAGLMPSMM